MSARNRSNPLALAVLICLYERPMHPYEVATTLRQRHKEERSSSTTGRSTPWSTPARDRTDRGRETVREGRLPERTVYGSPTPGGSRFDDWLTDLVSTPAKDYTAVRRRRSPFSAAVRVADDVRGAARRAGRRTSRPSSPRPGARAELSEKRGFPACSGSRASSRPVLRAAELAYVRRLTAEIAPAPSTASTGGRPFHDPGPRRPVTFPDAAHRRPR